MIASVSAGILFGLSAGFSPGPLMLLTLSHSLRYGVGAGVAVASAPLVTDLPIVLGVLYLLLRISEVGTLLGWVSLLGGCYVLFLGFKTFTAGPVNAAKAKENVICAHHARIPPAVEVPQIIGLRQVSIGDFVNAGDDLVRLVEMDPIKVDFRIGEVYLPDIRQGQTISIDLNAFPDEQFAGEVYAIEPQVG